MSTHCYTCREPFSKDRPSTDAPCKRREHATHEGVCYSYAHCAATLDGEAPVCGACGVESDTLRGSFLALPPGMDDQTEGGASFELVGWAAADPGMAAVYEMLAQLPPVTELPSHATQEAVSEEHGPAKAHTFIDGALGRARTPAVPTAAIHEEIARGAAMLRLEEAAGRWRSTTFADPRIALMSRGQRAGEGLLRSEVLVAARIGIDDLARAGRLTPGELPVLAPNWGDLRALGVEARHLSAHRLGGLSPALLARHYRITAAVLCSDVIPEGVAGLSRIGYTAVELRVLGVSAPWLLAGAAGANNHIARIAQFRRSTSDERPFPLSEWKDYLELTSSLLMATRDFSEARLMQIWDPEDVYAFMQGDAVHAPPVVFGKSPGNAVRQSRTPPPHMRQGAPPF